MGETWQSAFKARPWEHVAPEALSEALKVPSMLTAAESKLYYWIGQNTAGIGASVDLGAFAGGSSARLLAGLADSGHPYHLHAYDRFTCDPVTWKKVLAPQGFAATGDSNILPMVQQFLQPWAPHVTLHCGDIRETSWAGRPIEVLLVDAAKHCTTLDRIASEFYPSLVPGASLVVHQDYLHPRQPWIPAQMALLAQCFTPLALIARECVVFLCTAVPTADQLAEARMADRADEDIIKGLRGAEKTCADIVPLNRLRDQIHMVRANPGVRHDHAMDKSILKTRKR